ncbi:MAG: leucine-rich repeat protein [Bacteroidaceae bacterium]|nr:leucine-rich repeat protein [Bacteroidaceae bacterium]
MKCNLKSPLLVLAMMLCTTPLFAHDFEVDGIFYNITSDEDMTVAVTFKGLYYDSYYAEYSGNITIPESLTFNEKTYSVTSIGSSAFRNCSGLTSVTIGDGVTSIGGSAFSGCYDLTSITIPGNVTSIGSWAFEDCCNLTSVTIGDGVTSIGYYAFSDCTKLTSITIPNSVTSIENGAFARCSNLTSIIIPNSLTNIGDNVFSSCSSLTAITIPSSVTSISKVAFSGCSGLTSIVVEAGNAKYDSRENCNAIIESESNTLITGCMNTIIPNSVTSIGEGAFSNCSGLTSVTIPNSVTSIGYSAFKGCTNLTSITIPESVTSIESYAFSGCSCLTTIDIPTSVTSIGGYVFNNTPWYNNLPDGIVYIGKVLYKYKGTMPKDTDIEVQEGTISISPSAFSDYSYLKSISIPNSVLSIGDHAFYYCTGLTSVSMGDSVTSIGESAFYNCYNLATITLPRTITEIEDYAFSCSGLTEVISYIPADKLFPVAISTFFGIPSECVLTVPSGATDTYATTEGWNHAFEEIVELPMNVVLKEGENFVNAQPFYANTLTYSRTLPNLMWNALYLPVEIPIEALIENYDVAYFNDMHAYDRNSDGVVDDMNMEIFLLKEGTLHANHPYLIRAKNEAAKQMNLELTDVTVHSSAKEYCTSIPVSSAYMDFELAGVYTRHEGSVLENCYAITAKGAWSPIAQSSYLNPFRLYLKMMPRPGSPIKVSPQALQSIRISVQGEDELTGIEANAVNEQTPTEIYDLQGRRVTNPKKGLYIVNGKKVMF